MFCRYSTISLDIQLIFRRYVMRWCGHILAQRSKYLHHSRAEYYILIKILTLWCVFEGAIELVSVFAMTWGPRQDNLGCVRHLSKRHFTSSSAVPGVQSINFCIVIFSYLSFNTWRKHRFGQKGLFEPRAENIAATLQPNHVFLPNLITLRGVF